MSVRIRLTLGVGVLTTVLLAEPDRSAAQFYPYGNPGVAAFGYDIGYPPVGYGYPFAGLATSYGYSGYGWAWGYPAVAGYPPVPGYGYAPLYAGGYATSYGAYGFYPPGGADPASLSLGITPLAIQSILMERGLRGTALQSNRSGLAPGVYRIEQVGPGPRDEKAPGR